MNAKRFEILPKIPELLDNPHKVSKLNESHDLPYPGTFDNLSNTTPTTTATNEEVIMLKRVNISSDISTTGFSHYAHKGRYSYLNRDHCGFSMMAPFQPPNPLHP